MYDGIYLIINLLLLFGLICFIYGPYQNLIVDIFRQRLFVIRDEIFDLAKDGKLDFADTRYRTIRSSIELDIRFLHSTTLPRVLLAGLFMNSGNTPSSVSVAISSIEDPELRQTLQNYRRDASLYVLGSAGLRSPVIMISLIPVLIYKFCVGDLFAAISWAKSDIEKREDRNGQGGLPSTA
jgi:hypothetical protein